ncbi:hypothetical protein V1525DRAFT_448386 [Lipomyces kononenkoae]|uniref:Uncharacterized protein n=1 Tax=Lipomyces kononenkoae TaxID=34357 RepID=A0ACC3TBE8_LIPKO
MVRKTSRKITYLLASQSSHHGHTLGINSLAVDPNPPSSQYSGQLYSAGRDGMIMAWNLEDMVVKNAGYASIDDLDADTTSTAGVTTAVGSLGLNHVDDDTKDHTPSTNGVKKPQGKSTFRTQVQMHTHWVNDIALVNNYQNVVSCSSDLTVKIWHPRTDAQTTIGQHHDFVKCLAVDSQESDWIASGGLDRKVILWDLNGGGEKLQIDVGKKGENQKGSIYGLGTGGPGGSIVGSGGPDSIVRLWDQRTGGSILDFVGHTGNIRSILINKAGNLVLTGSSDATIKLWSITAGRLVHTLNMHDTSVWSLHSNHPNLEVFHSSDRSGLVVKTDMRGTSEAEDSMCVLVCNEHEGVNEVVASGDYLWTATANSRIHRWRDVDTTPATMQLQRLQRSRRRSSVGYQPRSQDNSLLRQAASAGLTSQIPVASLISLNAGTYGPSLLDPEEITLASATTARSEAPVPPPAEPPQPEPLWHNPDETIEGQTGLIKHILLNDRRRVLTVDTAGEVVLWDLIKCVMVRSYGSRDIQEVADEINTFETMTNWCQVNTRTGQLAVVLEESYCFDAEIYADEVAADLPPQPTSEPVQFRDDQRINLGRWILRNLFANLIEAEIRRDNLFRAQKRHQLSDRETRRGPPGHLSFSHMPPMTTWNDGARNANGTSMLLPTPGLVIGLATPAPAYNPANPPHVGSDASSTVMAVQSPDMGLTSPGTNGGAVVTDYFSSALSQVQVPSAAVALPSATASEIPPALANDGADDQTSDNLSTSSSLMGRLRSFGKGRLNRTVSTDSTKQPESKTDAGATDPTTISTPLTTVEEGKVDQSYEDTLAGVLQRIRHEYESTGTYDSSNFSVSLPNETPILTVPAETAIIISEQRVDAGGTMDLYRGTVSSCGEDSDVATLQDAAPGWLAEFLLLSKVPQKELVKVSFVLQPFADVLPALPNGNARLNAYRMLRAKKICAYVEEKLDSSVKRGPGPADEWLELVCQGQVVDNSFTLATIRARVWRSGGDVVLLYRRRNTK